MQKIKWILGGVILGFFAAHFVNQTPGGKSFFDRVNQGLKEFNDAVLSGYNDA